MKIKNGFTLIEVLIVVAILGIIAAVAIPSYSSYITKTRRAEAMALLTEVAGEQERYFSENNSYAAALTEIGYPADAIDSEAGSYSVSITAQTATSFTLTAARVAGKPQERDDECGDLTINSIGTKGITGSGSVADCW